MLIGSTLGSEFTPLPSAPWSMEPPRAPMGGGSLPPPPSMQLSPTGMFLFYFYLFTHNRRLFVLLSGLMIYD